MSTYCISDIHGCFNEFQDMLKLINFQEKDKLYILGDIIDRGPQSAEMLWYATKEAPANVHFLLGNHEDMMLAANYYMRDNIGCRYWDNGSYNGGLDTVQQIYSFDKHYDGGENTILDGIDCLPLYYDINVNNKRFILVHAALQSIEKIPDDYISDGKAFFINIDGLPCPQSTQAMLGNRTSGIFDRFEGPCDIITGHTPVTSMKNELFDEFGIDYEQNTKNGIFHFGPGCRKHIIDCGVHKNNYLACLRLDDMKEFYIKSR